MKTNCKDCGREELKVKMIPRVDKTYICQDCMSKHLTKELQKIRPGQTLYIKQDKSELVTNS